mmetsp:Transcript_64556/g.127541  ORF Transcript_64556/g.127541 Transcript_64556/m.127541 type:complete len:149 (-) Transcript_64556:394-840(-)
MPLVLQPAVAELFGEKEAARIYWSIWIALPLASVAGNGVLAAMREANYKSAALALVDTCDETAFEAAFGAPLSAAGALIESKTVTISQLMRLVPEGTVDPSPHLYDYVLQAFALIGIGAVGCNWAAFRRPPMFDKRRVKRLLNGSSKA